jgi:exonuclease III
MIILNIHFRYAQNPKDRTRPEQIKACKQKIKESRALLEYMSANNNKKIIALGDFNVANSTPSVKCDNEEIKLYKEFNFESYKYINLSEWTNFDKVNDVKLRIDYLIYNGNPDDVHEYIEPLDEKNGFDHKKLKYIIKLDKKIKGGNYNADFNYNVDFNYKTNNSLPYNISRYTILIILIIIMIIAIIYIIVIKPRKKHNICYPIYYLN